MNTLWKVMPVHQYGSSPKPTDSDKIWYWGSIQKVVMQFNFCPIYPV